jgi:hypothetical protein
MAQLTAGRVQAGVLAFVAISLPFVALGIGIRSITSPRSTADRIFGWIIAVIGALLLMDLLRKS